MATLAKHVSRLTSWLEGIGVTRNWSTVLLVDDKAVFDGSKLRIDPEELKTEDGYTARYDELVAAGYSWIHLNALGTLDATLVVTVAWPRDSSGVGVEHIAMNVSHELPNDLARYVCSTTACT